MCNILVIDDQPYIGEFLAEALADEEHHITCLSVQDYVMSYIKESNPDVILIDPYLRGFEGWELLDKIIKYDPSVPVTIMTAHDSFRDDPRLAHAGACTIKGINVDNLKQAIDENSMKLRLPKKHQVDSSLFTAIST